MWRHCGEAGRWRLISTFLAWEVTAVCIDTLLGLCTIAVCQEKHIGSLVYVKRDTVGAVSYNCLCRERDCCGLWTKPFISREALWDQDLQPFVSRKTLLKRLFTRMSRNTVGTLNYSRSCQERDCGELWTTAVYVQRETNCWVLWTVTIYVQRVTFGTLNYSCLCPERHFWDSELQPFMSRETLLGLWCMSRESLLGLWTTVVYVKRVTVGTPNYSRLCQGKHFWTLNYSLSCQERHCWDSGLCQESHCCGSELHSVNNR
jgi:hypothetical protein